MRFNPRHQELLELLTPNEERGVGELARAVGSSAATIRRDLTALAEAGKVIRTHGGALLRAQMLREADFVEKAETAVEAKRAIGRAVAETVPEGACVFVDAGTTCLEAARGLLKRGDCRLITHSVPVLVESCRYSVPVTAVGGEVRGITRALVGGTALGWLNDLRTDVALMGASGLDAAAGAFTTEPLEAGVKICAMEHAREVWLLADAGKWQHPEAQRFAAWDRFSRWFVNDAETVFPSCSPFPTLYPV